ncbi:MAG: aldo/keto reductase [Actinobacteria bacterium]|nr:aldo/keto reductase [Actinomycetota bacterium]
MEKRSVPHTDLEISRLVMGTMTFGSQVDEQGAARMVGCCLDEGINMFDTANAYNEGRSEEILGKLIAPHRAEVLIATKVFNSMGGAPDDRGLTKTAIHKAIEASLRRLGTPAWRTLPAWTRSWRASRLRPDARSRTYLRSCTTCWLVVSMTSTRPSPPTTAFSTSSTTLWREDF